MRYNFPALKLYFPVFSTLCIWLGVFACAGWAAEPQVSRLSPLAEMPSWRSLYGYQESITHKDFVDLLDRVYAPAGAWKDVIRVEADRALVMTTAGNFWELRFAESRETAKPVRRKWRARSELTGRTKDQPLHGVKITLDPGHIGGDWAKIEERWFQIGGSTPVTEGDMTLYVAKMLAERLDALGAQVTITRSNSRPVTSLRPDRLTDEAMKSLVEKDQAITPASVKREAERLFYRAAEIRRRARLVNARFKPDLVLCLHFNAEAWGNESRPTLSEKNHLHFLVTGAFSASELGYEDQRFNMLQKLLSRAYPEELAVTESIADAMSANTGLPPYQYIGTNAIKVGRSPYIWARNLLANRLFNAPVVYLEPYVMNNREVFARIQAGDYEGVREVAGAIRPSIYREYVDSVVHGLVDYYSPK
jgi:N-acetylmuramoyl-L-alanine amidase